METTDELPKRLAQRFLREVTHNHLKESKEQWPRRMQSYVPLFLFGSTIPRDCYYEGTYRERVYDDLSQTLDEMPIHAPFYHTVSDAARSSGNRCLSRKVRILKMIWNVRFLLRGGQRHLKLQVTGSIAEAAYEIPEDKAWGYLEPLKRCPTMGRIRCNHRI